MSLSDKDKQNINEASEELTLEDLEADVTDAPITFTATLHFEFSDIFNAIEHIEPEQDAEEDAEPELSEEPEEPESEAEAEPELSEDIPEPDVETETEPELPEELEEPEEGELEVEETEEIEQMREPEEPAEPQSEPAEPENEEPAEPQSEPAEPEVAAPPAELQNEQPRKGLIFRLRSQDAGTKKLVLTDIILLAVIVISIIVGLAVANSLVNKANAANEQKIAEMQANIKEVKLAEKLYNMAADQVIDDIAVPTYTLDELYALDLREKTGFTAKDLEMITRKGLVGCEEAFVKAEETYGVNSIFLISIASLESAYGTMMFRPNNMFGYGRTGFSSKEECIMTVAKGLGTRYLPPGGSLYGGSPTLKGVNKRYAANPQWYYKVGKYMQGYYAELAAAKNGALDKFE